MRLNISCLQTSTPMGTQMHLLFKQRNAGCENEKCVRLKLAKNTCVTPGTGCMIGPNVFYRYLGAEGIPLVCPPCNLEECCRTPGVLRTDATHCSSYGRSLWHWKYHLSDSDKHMYITSCHRTLLSDACSI